MNTKIEAVIFDLDGTVINTESIWIKNTVNYLTQKQKITLNDSDIKKIKSLAGLSDKDYFTAFQEAFHVAGPINKMIQDLSESFAEQLESNINFVDGFEDFHNKLKELNIKTCIASNSTIDDINTFDKAIDLKQFFGNNIFSISHVENGKPAPDLFLHAVEKLNINPQQSIIFEDSLTGFRAAHAAGIKCIGIKYDHNKDHLHLTHDAIDNFFEAPKILNLE